MRWVRCVNENRKKRKRLPTANHGCHCFDQAFLLWLALAFVAGL